jgi:hypothetical protein
MWHNKRNGLYGPAYCSPPSLFILFLLLFIINFSALLLFHICMLLYSKKWKCVHIRGKLVVSVIISNFVNPNVVSQTNNKNHFLSW